MTIDPKYRKGFIFAGVVIFAIIAYLVLNKWGMINSSTVKFPAVVYTSAGYCGYCKEFKPLWKKLKSRGFKTQDGIDIQFIEVTSDSSNIDKFPPVESYPTIRYHYSYVNYTQFDGARTEDALVEFINSSQAQRESYSTGPSSQSTDPAQQSVVGTGKGAMVPATVPSGPASGPSLIANRASFSMFSDKEYIPPSAIVPSSKKDCKKETKCSDVDYTKSPSSLGSGINTQSPLFYHGGYLPTNLTDRTLRTARFPKERNGVYLVEHW